ECKVQSAKRQEDAFPFFAFCILHCVDAASPRPVFIGGHLGVSLGTSGRAAGRSSGTGATFTDGRTASAVTVFGWNKRDRRILRRSSQYWPTTPSVQSPYFTLRLKLMLLASGKYRTGTGISPSRKPSRTA